MEYANYEGRQVHVSQVERGSIAQCIVCGEKVIAKVGKKLSYFAHEKGKSEECELKIKNMMKKQDKVIEYDLNNSEIDNIYGNVYNDDIESINGFTDEQLAIINSTERRVKVDAKVGVGKTSTIEEYIRRNPEKRVLYAVYNRSMREESESRFGDSDNVDIRTTYSLAYEEIGYEYRSMLKSSINIFDVAKAVNIFMKKPEEFMFIEELMKLFEYYLTSKYHSIDEFFNNTDKDFKFEITGRHVGYLKKLFKASYDKKCSVTHDFYFKLYHLSKPDYSKRYDVLCVDELQDSSYSLVDIIINNTNIEKIIVVGDFSQAIYQFANCVNGLEILDDGWTNYPLTKSFRLGNTQAKLIAKNMSDVLGKKFVLEGYNKKQNVVRQVDRSQPHYKLCRFNATILREAILNALEGRKVYINGGKAGVEFNYIKLIYDFRFHGKKHFTLKKFENYEHMIRYAERTKDYNTLFIDKLIQDYGESLIFKIRELEDNLVDDWMLADVCFSTIHKSKGMTITIPVVIADDVLDWNEIEFDNLDSYIPEINLMYVGISRSKFDMEIPDFMLNIYLNGIDKSIVQNKRSVNEKIRDGDY